MKKYFLPVILLLAITTQTNAQQAKTDTWAKWKFLIGDWDGQGTGKPGDGAGGFTLQPDLDGRVLVRKNHADYPAANGRPAFSHNDLMVVYPGDKAPNAIYFDNEGHVINYAITFNDTTGAIVFTSEASANAMRFKLTYTPVGNVKVNIKFEMAPPGKPDAFSTYIEASAVRKK
jgi:hypothetical protein